MGEVVPWDKQTPAQTSGAASSLSSLQGSRQNDQSLLSAPSRLAWRLETKRRQSERNENEVEGMNKVRVAAEAVT